MRTVLADGNLPVSAGTTEGAGQGPAAAPVTVRVVEYHLLGADGGVTEVFALPTNMLDPQDARPATRLLSP